MKRFILRCIYCGQFIKHSDFENGKAKARLNQYCQQSIHDIDICEDSYQYHIVCRLKDEGEPK